MKKILSVLVLFLLASSSFATTADDISKNVNTLIRNAEKEFFNGKAKEAATLLQEAKDNLEKLKSADPNHKSIKTLQTKYDRLKDRVDKKLGSSTSTAAPKTEAKPGTAKPSSESKELSQGAKNNLKSAGTEMDFAEKELAKGEQSLQDGKFNLVESYIFNTNSKLQSAKGMLDRVINNNKANPDHPDVASALQRHKALQEKLTAFTTKASGKEADLKQAATQATENAAKLSEKWLPRITPFNETASDSRLQYPGSYNASELEKQETLYSQAKKVLADVETDVPAGDQPHDLKRAVDKLRFNIEVYENEKKADNANRLQPIDNTLAEWEKRFEQNKTWNEGSDKGLFVITTTKLEYQKKQIAELRTVSPESAAGFSKRLEALEKENKTWTEKKRLWQEHPRPFPKAKMTSENLEKQMKKLLADRSIEVIDLAIVDKDWWVQPGEFRYVTTAVLSKDNKGKYWSNISFRQIKTLTGYGPTEIWNIDEIRIRLP